MSLLECLETTLIALNFIIMILLIIDLRYY